MRVGYFPGCAPSLYPLVGEAVLEVLGKNRVQIIVPEGLACCGAPFLEAGDFSTARKLAQANIEAFAEEDMEAIVVSCSAGLRALRGDYENLLGLQGFRVPVVDLAEFLADVLSTREQFSPMAMKMVYMNGRRSEESGNWERKILAEIPELELVELGDPEGRCGESLFFAALHPELFRKMMDKRLAAVAETGAVAVITNNPICMWQLETALQDGGKPVKVMHTAEVLAAAYEGGGISSNKARAGVAQRKKS
jgi:glycolate oxidase iron-sulfur subunit